MKKFNYIFIGVVLAIIIIGSIIIWFISPKTPAKTTPPKALPTAAAPQFVSPSPFPVIPQNIQTNIQTQLPYETNEFLVEYYPTTDKYFATIKGEPYKTNYNKAVIWLKAQKVPSPTNNAKVQFVFAGYRKY